MLNLEDVIDIINCVERGNVSCVLGSSDRVVIAVKYLAYLIAELNVAISKLEFELRDLLDESVFTELLDLLRRYSEMYAKLSYHRVDNEIERMVKSIAKRRVADILVAWRDRVKSALSSV